MNTLWLYIQAMKFDPVECMKRLQDHGIVSDLAVMPEDVAEADCPDAIAFLRRERKMKAEGRLSR